METTHDDPFHEPNGDNQGLNTIDTSFYEHKFAGDEELVAENMDSWLDETSNKSNSQTLAPSPKFTSRKVHSAAPITSGFDHSDSFDDIPRPYTAAEPSTSNTMARPRKKKSADIRKKTAKDSKMPRKERPRSADLNGWGDFDTDRLLRDDFQDQSNQTPIDPQDGQRIKSRKSRRSTPATHSPRTNPWEGYLIPNNEIKESSKPPVQMQVLRQKSIEILNLDLAAQEKQHAGRSVTTPKPLLGQVSMERLLSSGSRPVISHVSRSATPTHLFGTDIRDTSENRATIFRRFTDLWSLIAQSSESAPSGAAARSPFDAQTRSPFECSMTMVKICKTVGISLTPSAATRLSFWGTNEQAVAFESFCDLVIKGAIQPALHQFNLDNSMGEYVSALDTILQSLVVTESTRCLKDTATPPHYIRRIKELNEIQPLFVNWKAGVSPRLVQPTEIPTATPTKAHVTAKKVRKAVEASVSQHMLANQLPSEEARVTHVENIRRKVQLHKSWKLSAESKIIKKRISSPMTQVSRDGHIFSHEKRIPTSQAADLAEMLDHARTVFPTGIASDDTFLRNEDRPVETPTFEANGAAPENDENEEVLICCSCSVREAVLWCSSCFTVNCQKCWQEIHSCTVDMSIVSSELRKPLIGPTALAMTKKRSDPPVPMIYLPTKASVSGTLAKGNPIVRHNNPKRNISNQITSSTKDEVPGVVANAILPSLHKSRSDTTVFRHHERLHVENNLAPTTDSTTELVKSLMLRMSPSTPTTGNRSTMDSAMRKYNNHTSVRPKLHLAPVSLDAEFLLSNTPERRR